MTTTATSGLITHSLSASLRLTDFNIALTGSSTQTVAKGVQAQFPITINKFNGFNYTVDFSVSSPSPLPNGVTASFSPSTASNSTVFNVSSSRTGTYNFTLGGSPTGSFGSPSRTVNVTLIVQ
jgi:hypothetical protein